MRIGEVARTAGVGVETIRYYENVGLIEQPLRPADGGYRNYPAEIVGRIRFIKSAQRLGFSLQEIDQLLALDAGPETQCADIRDRASTKLDDVIAEIENLTRIKTTLERLIDACPGQGPVRQCSILSEIKRKVPILEGDANG